MIPPDIRLYTWIDVEEVLLRIDEKAWPDYLAWARAYWNELTVGIRPGHKESAISWLEERFTPRFDSRNLSITLESVEGIPRELQVYFEETDEMPREPRSVPSFSRTTVVQKPQKGKHPPSLLEGYPPVIVFHSFKGGVGRTLHALALARGLAQKGSRILLIDGDLEAPGLTWLLYSRIPQPEISLVDLLALAHGDSSQEYKESIELAAEKVKGILLDRIFVLPSFRAISHFTTLEIKPEHLIKSSEDPYVMTFILAKLGQTLGVDAVIVDLRAGFSELSTGLLLDPRVYKVIVTTLSSQSIQGTCQLLKTLSEFQGPLNKDVPLPSIVITQVPKEYIKGELVTETEKKIINEFNNFRGSDLEDDLFDLNILTIPFIQNLFVLPEKWDDVVKDIHDLINQLNPLIDWLPGRLFPASPDQGETPKSELKDQRNKLADFSHNLIYAETSGIKEFLAITPLQNLATDFRNRVPIVVVIGAKGAGKTYAYLQIMAREIWGKFVKQAVDMEVSIEANVCPILHSKNIDTKLRDRILKIRASVIDKINPDRSEGDTAREISDYLRENLKKDLHEGQWRECWLNMIAWTCGFKRDQEGAGRAFIEFLRGKKQFVIGIIDGLEDWFQDLPTDKNQQTALRSLIQEVPEWLEQQPSRPIGLIVFVRQDMVNNAIKQNTGQLMQKYLPYTLKWDKTEALRLAAWISVEAGVIKPDKKSIQERDYSELVDFLCRLWGRKLGSEKSNEARSAEWVISVLSDLKGQIQARDIVRLLNKAAEESQQYTTYWNDRLLAPQSIRNAVKECSEQKIEEISQENPSLGKIFDHLKNLADEDSRRIPFSRESVNLKSEAIDILEKNGVIIQEQEDYYMPEIFRRGLNFKLKAGARPRVLSLSRRARK